MVMEGMNAAMHVRTFALPPQAPFTACTKDKVKDR